MGNTFKSDKVREYLGLSLHGLVQGCSFWWMNDKVCILEAFVHYSCVDSMFEILLINVQCGLGYSVNIRVGNFVEFSKYSTSPSIYKHVSYVMAVPKYP